MFTFQFLNDKIDQNTNLAKLPGIKWLWYNFIIQKLKSKHLVCLSFLWWEVFLREREKIFCTYSRPYSVAKYWREFNIWTVTYLKANTQGKWHCHQDDSPRDAGDYPANYCNHLGRKLIHFIYVPTLDSWKKDMGGKTIKKRIDIFL